MFKITVIKDDVNKECEDPTGSQMGKQTDVTPSLCDPEKVRFRQGILATQTQNHSRVFFGQNRHISVKTANLLAAGRKQERRWLLTTKLHSILKQRLYKTGRNIYEKISKYFVEYPF